MPDYLDSTQLILSPRHCLVSAQNVAQASWHYVVIVDRISVNQPLTLFHYGKVLNPSLQCKRCSFLVKRHLSIKIGAKLESAKPSAMMQDHCRRIGAKLESAKPSAMMQDPCRRIGAKLESAKPSAMMQDPCDSRSLRKIAGTPVAFKKLYQCKLNRVHCNAQCNANQGQKCKIP